MNEKTGKNYLILVALLTVFMTIFFGRPASAAEFGFENTMVGATGWASTNIAVTRTPGGQAVGTLTPGTPFTIISPESGGMCAIRTRQGLCGYINTSYLMINMQDIFPETKYDITASAEGNGGMGQRTHVTYNGQVLPITGMWGWAPYGSCKANNTGLNRRYNGSYWLVPLQYSTAKKFAQAKAIANSMGYDFLIWDAYRPRSCTTAFYQRTVAWYNSQPAAIRSYIVGNWGMGWFFASGTSTHNYGVALDMTLINKATGLPVPMPSDFDEISQVICKYTSPYSGVRKTGGNWGNAWTFWNIVASAGFSELKSEWWHIQDNSAPRVVQDWYPSAMGGCSVNVQQANEWYQAFVNPAAAAQPTVKTMKATSITQDSKGINIKWNAVPGAAYYKVQCMHDGNAAATSVKNPKRNVRVGSTDKISGTEVKDTAAQTNARVYGYQVYAFNYANKTIAKSNALYIQRLPATNFTLKSSKAGQIEIEWPKKSYAAGYRIYYDKGNSITSKAVVKFNNTNTLKRVVTGLAKGTTYTVRMETQGKFRVTKNGAEKTCYSSRVTKKITTKK